MLGTSLRVQGVASYTSAVLAKGHYRWRTHLYTLIIQIALASDSGSRAFSSFSLVMYIDYTSTRCCKVLQSPKLPDLVT